MAQNDETKSPETGKENSPRPRRRNTPRNPATDTHPAAREQRYGRETSEQHPAASHTPKSGSNGGKGGRRGRPMKIIPLGGLDGIGKNMTALVYGNDMLLIDAGLMFPDDDHPGVDLILPDYTYVLEHAEDLRGIIITHGHEDHTGALPYLLKDLGRKVPILGTKLTLGLIKGKLAEHNLNDQKLREVVPGEHTALGVFGCDFFNVNHSIPGAMGLFVRSPAGTLLHTGDFKLDQTPINGELTDFAALSHFSKVGVDVMLSDSTNAQRKEFTKSEAEVGKVLRQIISQAERRVVVASFASHIHRLQQVCDAARLAGRKVAVTGRSMITNTQIARDLGYLNVSDDLIIDAYDARDYPREKLVVLCTGSQGEPLSALARMANGEHRTIDIEEGDTVIISATPVPGNEKAVTRVKNALSKIGADVFDKSVALVHVSGHASSEELKLMMALVKPRNFMPVHGESQHLRAHRDLALSMGIAAENTFILDNGDTLELLDGKLTRGEQVENGIVYVDGLSVGDVSTIVLKDRKTLASDGIVTVVCLINTRKGSSAGEPELIMRGVTGGDDPTLQTDAVQAVQNILATHTREYQGNPGPLKKKIREDLSRLLWERCRRRPMIIPIIMEV
jgi:ribonuclease J